MRFLCKSLVVCIVLLFLSSSFVLADTPHKDNPGKDKKKPPIVEPVDNISIVWVSNAFGGVVFFVSDDDGIWSEWGSWWTIWNVLSDGPILNDGFSVSVNVKYRIES